MLDSELIPWFPICYEKTLEKGGYYDADDSMIGSWSHQKKNPLFYVENGRLPWESLCDSVRKISGEDSYKELLNHQLQRSVAFLSSIKYNSNTENLILYGKRIRKLQPKYAKSVWFWTMFFIAFFTPKIVLRFVRFLYIQRAHFFGKIPHEMQIMKQIQKVRGFA